MEKQIRERFNDAILAETGARYGVTPEQIQLLDGFESFMFEFELDGRATILRLSHSLRRSVDLIRGEIEWINYLHAHGAGVARALPSVAGHLVELIDDGEDGHFLATAFIKARGGRPWLSPHWGDGLFERYGRLIGRMNHLSRQYEPANPAWIRPHWDDPVMLFVENFLPESQTVIKAQYKTLLGYLRALPQDRQNYGLIHQDAHASNFFVDEEGQITLFDFDDCVYSWYANDVAIVLFYAVTNHEDPEGFGRRFMRHFMRGYRQETDLDAFWLEQIPHFLKLREMDLYAVVYRSFDDVNNIEHDWTADFMRGRRERIENSIPYLAINFTE